MSTGNVNRFQIKLFFEYNYNVSRGFAQYHAFYFCLTRFLLNYTEEIIEVNTRYFRLRSVRAIYKI